MVKRVWNKVLLVFFLFLAFASFVFSQNATYYWNYTTVANTSPYYTNKDVNITYYFVSNDSANLTCNFFINNTYRDNQTVLNGSVANEYVNASNITLGNFTWYINCTNGSNIDTFGNVTIVVDKVAPNVTILPMINKYNTQPVQIQYIVQDNYFSQVICNISINNTLYISDYNVTGSSTEWINLTNVGESVVLIFCRDAANNLKYQNISLFFDNVKPVINSIGFTNNTKVKNSISLSYNVTEMYPENISLHIEYSNSSNIYYYYGWTSQIGTINITNLGHSGYFEMDFTDNMSNINVSQHYYFTVDSTSPIINSSVPANINTVSNTSQNFTFTYNKNSSCSFYFNQTLNATYNYGNLTSYTVNLTIPFSYGTYNWSFNCTDDVGNTANVSGILVFDNQSPVVNKIIFANNSMSNNNTLPLTFNVTELSPYNFTMYYFNLTANTTTVFYRGLNWTYVGNTGASVNTFTFNTNSTGNYQFNITFCDVLSYCTTFGSLNFSVDKEPPVPNIPPLLYAANGNLSQATNVTTPTNESTITLYTNISDVFSGISTVLVYYDYKLVNTSNLAGNSSFVFNNTYNIAYPGMHTFMIVSTDIAGNSVANNLSFYSTSDFNLSSVVSRFVSNVTRINSFDIFSNGTNVSAGNISQTDNIFDFVLGVNSSFQTSVNISGVNGNYVLWNNTFNVYNYDSLANATVLSMGATPIYILSIKNITHFINTSYSVTVVININISPTQKIHYCTDSGICTQLNNSGPNMYYYTNASNNMTYITIPSFSSIVISNDSFVTPVNIISPNSSVINNGIMTLNISFGEFVNGTYFIMHNNTNSSSYFFTTTQLGNNFVFTKFLSGTGDVLNGLGYSDGVHTIVLNYTDSNGNNNVTYYNVTFAFNQSSITVYSSEYLTDDTEGNSSSYTKPAGSFYIYSPIPFTISSFNLTCTGTYPPVKTPSSVVYNTGNFYSYFPPDSNVAGDSGVVYFGTCIYTWTVSSIDGNYSSGSDTLIYTQKTNNNNNNNNNNDNSNLADMITANTVSINSTQGNTMNNILLYLSEASDSINTNDTAANIKEELNLAYAQEKALQDSYALSIQYIKDLQITNLSEVGVNFADYTNSLTTYNDINALISNANSQTDLTALYSNLNDISTKQELIMFYVPEITKVNHFTSTVVLSDVDLNVASSYSTIDSVKNTIKRINLSDASYIKVDKFQDNYQITNAETSVNTMYRTKIGMTLTAVQDVSGVSLIEVIPKSVLSTTDDILYANINYNALQSDPVISWNLGDLKTGDSKSIYYITNNQIVSMSTISLFDGSPSEKSVINTSTAVETPLSNSGNISNNVNTVSFENQSNNNSKQTVNTFSPALLNTLLIIVIVICLICAIVFGVLFLKKTLKKTTTETQKPKPEAEHHKLISELKKHHDNENKKKQLNDIIIKCLSEGLETSEIKELLMKKGWPQDLVGNAITNLSMDKFKNIRPKEDKKDIKE